MLSYIAIAIIGISAIMGLFQKKAAYLGILVGSAYYMLSGFNPADQMSYFILIACLAWILVSLYSLSYDRHYGKWLASSMALMIMGMVIILQSTNYLLLITGWETMSVPAYVIVGMNKRDSAPAFTFMMFSEFSTILIIAGAVYAFFITGTLTFTQIPSYGPLLLISLGALIKMGMTPFMISEWLPIAHGNAPANASAALSATMTLMGVFAIMRMILVSPDVIWIGYIFLAIGSISILFASIYAYISENMKMLAGFSTIENNAAILSAMGLYLLASEVVLRQFIFATIIIFALSHSISKTGLFFSIGNSPGEYFGESGHPTSYGQRVGTMLTTMSLSGLFPTIGGLATWMLLEAFFMEAYAGGAPGMSAIVVGSVIALGEGMATGSMMKILAFGNLFHRKLEKKHSPNQAIISGIGLMLIFLFAISIFIVSGTFISGVPGVLVFNGFTITSRFGKADFGLISPDYVVLLITAFSLAAYALFRKPRLRDVPVWNGGSAEVDPYTSYAYSNNIRLMLRRVLRTKTGAFGNAVTVIDVFWLIMTDIGKGYRAVSKFITLRVMNSSIGWYMIYMIAAFLVIMLIAVLVY